MPVGKSLWYMVVKRPWDMRYCGTYVSLWRDFNLLLNSFWLRGLILILIPQLLPKEHKIPIIRTKDRIKIMLIINLIQILAIFF